MESSALRVLERLLGDLVERVEARRGGGDAGVGRRLTSVHLPACLTAAQRPVIGCWPPLTSVSVRPALRVEDVRFPVVEVQLGGGADLLGGAVGVRDAREVDLDLLAAEQLQLRLGDAERVDAVAHDLQRAVQRLLVDRRLLRGRLALVDELDAALEVQAELRRLRRDDHRGGGDQSEDQEQDEQRAAAIGHGPGGRVSAKRSDYRDGVSTSSSPPSSSYAGKRSATAFAGRSPSALTVTGLPSWRTPHSSTVPTWSSPPSKLEPEHLAHRAADDLLVREAGQLARAAAAADDPALLVADEERGVGRRVVVVEQLEEEPEAALLAALRDVAEALLAVLGRGPVAAVGADEEVRHLND